LWRPSSTTDRTSGSRRIAEGPASFAEIWQEVAIRPAISDLEIRSPGPTIAKRKEPRGSLSRAIIRKLAKVLTGVRSGVLAKPFSR
jgi:hypothetical protein